MSFQHLAATSEEEFFERSVDLLVTEIDQHIQDFGKCILGLSGGSTPQPIYTEVGKADLNWDAVTLFLVDERYVPETDNDSNQKMIRDTLLQHADISEDNILFPDTRLPLEECIEDYQVHLALMLSQGIPHVLTLGMGDDGHTASLFPPVGEHAFGDQLVLHAKAPQDFAVEDRISASMVVLCSADRKLLFLKGNDKKEAWNTMIEDEENVTKWPLNAVLKTGGCSVVSYW